MESQLKYFAISSLTENLLSFMKALMIKYLSRTIWKKCEIILFLYNKTNMKLHSIKGIKNIYSNMKITNNKVSNISKIQFVSHVYPILRYVVGVNKYRVVVFIFVQEKFRKLHPMKSCQGCIHQIKFWNRLLWITLKRFIVSKYIW